MQISPEQETVWLTQKQIEQLFDVKHAVVSEHISNILSSGKLDETSVGFSDKSSGGRTSVGFSDKSSGGRKPKIYNLDMILSVGYRVNSKIVVKPFDDGTFRILSNDVTEQELSLPGCEI